VFIPGNVSLFEGIRGDELSSLLSCLSVRVRSYVKGDCIIREGDPVDSLGIILSGFVQIVKNDYDGNRMIQSSFGTGALFAESFVCAGLERIPVSVIAAENSEILFIPFKKLMHTCEASCSFHQLLVENMMKVIARKNLMLSMKIEIASKRTTREKVLAYLGQEKLKAGQPGFCIPYSRIEMADFLCVDRCALSRELGRMQDEGLIEFDGNAFTLP